MQNQRSTLRLRSGREIKDQNQVRLGQNHSVKRKTIIYKGFELLIVTLSFALCTLSLSSTKVDASEFSIGIYPPLLKIQAQPPAIIRAAITIQNLSENSVNLDLLIKPLGALNENEHKVFFSQVQVVDKATPVKSLNLGPKQKKDLFVKMDIAKDIPQKDYYFSIQFISKADTLALEKETNYSQIQGGISLIVLTSIGKQDVKAVIEDFSSPFFATKSFVPFVITIKNKGTHLISPSGTITIKNMFGQMVGQIHIPSVNILKESARSINLSWNKHFIFGLYTATLDIASSKESPVFSRSLSFFALPVKPALIAVFLTLFILFLYTRVRKKTDI